MLKKIKSFFDILWKFVLLVLTPLFLIYKFGIKKPIDNIKIRKRVKESQKELKEVLQSNEDTNKSIDKSYNDIVDEHKSFKSRLRLFRARRNNKRS